MPHKKCGETSLLRGRLDCGEACCRRVYELGIHHEGEGRSRSSRQVHTPHEVQALRKGLGFGGVVKTMTYCTISTKCSVTGHGTHRTEHLVKVVTGHRRD
jgi:hypothetical protein